MWFDTHAHLYLLLDLAESALPDRVTIERELSPILQKAKEEGVRGIICPGIDRSTSELAITIADLFPSFVWAAVGIHPNSASQGTEEDWDVITQLATHPKVVAIGETGLDWFRNYTPRDQQVTWFRRHIELSRHVNKPLIVHCRDAEDDMTAILHEVAVSGKCIGVMHACAARWETVEQWLDFGMFVSFAGSVTFSNKKHLFVRETACHVPLERLLIETDCPFLVPEPLRGRASVCLPSNIALTGTFLAKLRNVPVPDLAQVTSANAATLFQLG